jgi:hypothetical protein
MTGLTYEDLVAAATVGLSHRPLQITGLSGAADEHAGLIDPGDQAAALLDAAALLVAARRAGVRPGPGLARPPAAPDDPAPELSARAADLLQAAGPGLLADLLGLAAEHGYRAPAPLLPALLDAAVRDRGLTTAVAGVLGARGRWLAGHRADWQRVADALPAASVPAASVPAASVPAASVPAASVPAASVPAASVPAGAVRLGATAPDDPGVWDTGRRAERRAYLVELRERDPAAARELLAAGWSRETGDDRADLLAVLARGLSPDDEDFLEAALDDRKASVRAEAARLLARLPGSRFTRRAAERAAPLLRLERHGARRHLVPSLAGGADAAAVRDGLSPGPRLFTQIIAAAPLAGWVTGLGMDAAQLASLPIAGDLAVAVRAGWRQAAIREADPQWAEALLAAGWPGPVRGQPPVTWPRDHELAAVLSPDARAARAASLLAAGATNTEAVAEVAGCPVPWPGPLADAVVAALRQVVAAAARSGAAAVRQVRAAQPAPALLPTPQAVRQVRAAQPAPALLPTPQAVRQVRAAQPAPALLPTPQAVRQVRAAQPVPAPLPPAQAAWPAPMAPASGPARPGWPAELAAVAGRGLPVTGPTDYAAVLARLADTDHCPAPWSSALRRAAEAIALRRAFLKEIR